MRRPALTLAAFCLATPTSAAAGYGGEILEELDCPAKEPMGLVVVGEHFFISDMATRTIVKVNKVDGSVVETFATPGFMPSGVAWYDGILYAADRRRETISRRRLDAVDEAPIPYFERWAFGMTHDEESLWVVDARSKKLHQLDPEDGTTIRSFPAPASRPTGIAFGEYYLWVADHKTDEIYAVDPMDGTVVAIIPAPGPYPSALAIDGDDLWVADFELQKLFRIALTGETPYLEDQERRVQVTYELLLRATGGSVSEVEARLAVPREIPGQHLLSELSFDPKPTRFETDQWDQRVAIFELGELAPGELATVRWQGDFALFRVRFQIDPDRVAGSKLPRGLEPYLADDTKYDLYSDTVVTTVDKVLAGETDFYLRARAVYEHLTKVISYDRSSGWNNAATVLARGTGSCSEYTFAMVALLRRAGIPARYVGAISERGGDASFDDVFHRWAEAYVPGYGWVPVDANAGHDELPGERARFFGGRSNRHVVTTIGGGASELLDWTYNSNHRYRSSDNGELRVQSIARYRPLASIKRAEPHEAPRVVAPVLTDARRGSVTPSSGDDDGPSSPWVAGIALILALGVGIVIGRFVVTRP